MARAREHALLGDAIRREAEPGDWAFVGTGELEARLDPAHPDRLDGEGLIEVGGWLAAADATREAWRGAEARERFPHLSGGAAEIPDFGDLARRLATSLEPDGRVSDAASPRLKRARVELER